MPVFIFLIVLAVILFWFLAAFAYKPIGKLFKKIWNDSMNSMKYDDDKKEN